MFESYESLMARFAGHLEDEHEVHYWAHDSWESDYVDFETEEEIIERYVDDEGYYGYDVLSYEDYRARYCEDCSPIFY